MAATQPSSRSVIVTCAVTGAIHTPTMSAHLPITPAQIAEEAIGAAEAGAAIVHLHARDPIDGRPSPSTRAVPGVPAAHQGRLRRGDQHHHRRRPEHDRAGPPGVRARLSAGDVLAQHGLDELRALPDAEPLQDVHARVGARLPRRQPRLHLQEHLRGHRVHPRAPRPRLRHALRVRVLRRRPPLQPGPRRRSQAGRAAVLRADDLRHPRRHRRRRREPAAHAADRRQAVRRRLRVVGAGGGAPPDADGDDGAP